MLDKKVTRDENVAGLTVYEFPDAGRLRICKLADRQHVDVVGVIQDMLNGYFCFNAERKKTTRSGNILFLQNLTQRDRH